MVFCTACSNRSVSSMRALWRRSATRNSCYRRRWAFCFLAKFRHPRRCSVRLSSSRAPCTSCGRRTKRAPRLVIYIFARLSGRNNIKSEYTFFCYTNGSSETRATRNSTNNQRDNPHPVRRSDPTFSHSSRRADQPPCQRNRRKI
jgi:hypothetical protein